MLPFIIGILGTIIVLLLMAVDMFYLSFIVALMIWGTILVLKRVKKKDDIIK